MRKIFLFPLEVLLWGIAFLLILPLTLINFVLVWLQYGTPKGYFLSSAVSIDRWANREFRTTWNAFLITPKSKHFFGNIDETISSVLGKNKRDKTLSFTGRCLAGLLDFLDKNHCEKSITF